MKKQIIATVVIFLMLVGFGLTEVFVVKDNFVRLETRLTEMYDKAENETLTEEEYNAVWEDWKNRREHIEFFLNHMDFTEMDLRMAECRSYVRQGDYDAAQAQIGVLIELTHHIPHMLIPTPEHIL